MFCLMLPSQQPGKELQPMNCTGSVLPQGQPKLTLGNLRCTVQGSVLSKALAARGYTDENSSFFFLPLSFFPPHSFPFLSLQVL